MKGCSHSICYQCSKKLAAQPYSDYYALTSHGPKQTQLICPLCRAVEPVKTAEELKHVYPDAYARWFNFQLYKEPCGCCCVLYKSISSGTRDHRESIRTIPKLHKKSRNRVGR